LLIFKLVVLHTLFALLLPQKKTADNLPADAY
jgi:hypothetical protein